MYMKSTKGIKSCGSICIITPGQNIPGIPYFNGCCNLLKNQTYIFDRGRSLSKILPRQVLHY